MHILLVSYLYEPQSGGAPHVVETLAHFLKAENLDVSILTTSEVKSVSVELIQGIKVIRFLPTNLYWIKNKDQQPDWKKFIWQIIDTWNPIVYYKAKEILKLLQPDIVHVHKLRGLSPAVWSTARSNQIPVIHTAHDFELISPQGTLSGRTGQMAQNGSPLLRPYQAVRALASNSVSAFTAPSQFVLDLHIQKGFFKNAVHKLIPNTHGYLPEELIVENTPRNKASVHNSKEIQLLYLGRLEKEKGIDRLCQAFDIASKSTSDLRLNIAGIGGLESQLRARYANNPAIRFLGFIHGENKIKTIQECNYLVVPSVCQEAFGISVVEAFAFGKPVIASRIGGLREVVNHNENGILIDPEDENDWVDKLIHLRLDHYYQKLCANALESSHQYSYQKMGEDYLNLYRTVLKTQDKKKNIFLDSEEKYSI